MNAAMNLVVVLSDLRYTKMNSIPAVKHLQRNENLGVKRGHNYYVTFRITTGSYKIRCPSLKRSDFYRWEMLSCQATTIVRRCCRVIAILDS